MPVAALKAPIDQIGILTDDLDRAVSDWIERLGVGPWMLFRNVTLDGTYRGAPTQVKMDVALGYRGETQIEFIQITNEAASPYRGADGAPLMGMHHIAWLTHDLDAATRDLEASGLTRVFFATNPAIRVAYFEDPAQKGMLYELIEGAGQREMVRDGIAAAKTWNGDNPIAVIDFEAPPA
jgi:catechol 2,3-dioxygenase-like lactoylglutathione lyase family enzyme